MSIPLALYPYSSDLLPFVNHFNELQDNYSLKKLYSLPGFGLNGYDAAYACNHPKSNFIVSDNLDIGDTSWETLLLAKSTKQHQNLNSHFFYIMKKTLALGKSVIYIDPSISTLLKSVRSLKEQYKDRLRIINDVTIFNDEFTFIKNYNQITTPIILIGSLIECVDSLEIIIKLLPLFIKNNCSPAVITKQPLGRFFGFHTINNLIYQSCWSESKKIEEINKFVVMLEKKELPSVILIEAPDAVLRFNDKDPNGFGILTYMMSLALHIDYFVCCIPFEIANGKLTELLSKDFSIRLNSPIHAVHASNVIVDSVDLIQTRKISFVHADLKRVQNYINNDKTNYPIPIFDFISNGIENLFQDICHRVNIV